MNNYCVTYFDHDYQETLQCVLWDAHWDDSTTVTGIDPATWCPETIENVIRMSKV